MCKRLTLKTFRVSYIARRAELLLKKHDTVATVFVVRPVCTFVVRPVYKHLQHITNSGSANTMLRLSSLYDNSKVPYS